MAISKRILSAVLSVVMVLSMVTVGIVNASAADITGPSFATASVDAGDGKLVVPTINLESTKVIRVAETSDPASNAIFKNGTTIVPATPSGLPQITSSFATQYYCDETPTSPTIVFTSDLQLATTPTISCENNTNITFSGPVQSGNTYTWTITAGTGVTVGALNFVVDYSYSYVDSLTNKTVTKYYKAYTTSYVETIAQPGSFSVYRSRKGSVGHENVRMGFVNRILGANTYGSFYLNNDETSDSWVHGYYDFIANNWVSFGSSNAANGYGTAVYEVSDNNSDGANYLNTSLDQNRPVSTTYIDRSLGEALSQVNLRLTYFERLGNRKSGYTYYARNGGLKLMYGEVEFSDTSVNSNAARIEVGLSQDLNSDVQMANNGYTNYPFTGSTYGDSATLDEATGNYLSTYTLVTNVGSHYSEVDRICNAATAINMRIYSYDKSELRGDVSELLTKFDPTTKLAVDSEIGINPQEGFYSAGWANYKSALQNAQYILSKPNTDQVSIDAALATLDTAVNGLVVAEADYSLVDIAKAEAAKKDAENYTEASWRVLQDAITAADESQGYSVFYQNAVDKLADDINAAILALEAGAANWDNVDTAVSAYEKLDPTKYTPETWVLLRNAVARAEEERAKVPAYTVNDQAYVESLAKAISDAILALDDALADYTYFDEQETRYQNEVLTQKAQIEADLAAAGIDLAAMGIDGTKNTIYDSTKWRRLQTARNFERGLTWQYQEDVNDATDTLKRAIDALTLRAADYSAVEAQIERAEEYDPDWYTPESYAVLEDAIDAVVDGKLIDEQPTVNGYATDIYNAIKNLDLAHAYYGAVEAAIEKADNINPAPYTPESYNAIYDIIDTIDWGLMAKDQAQVDAYAAAIEEAIRNLKEIPANYDVVREAIARWDAIPDKTIYTDISQMNVVNAINAVDYNKIYSEQTEVNAMAQAINDAIDALQEKLASYTELKAAYNAALAEIEKNDNFKAANNGYGYYTDATIADLEAAINAVPTVDGVIVEDKKLTEQADVNALTEALVNAKAALKVNSAIYDALTAELTKVPSDADLENLYTEETAVAVILAKADAEMVDPNLTIDDQQIIDDAVAALAEAIAALAFKPADYSTVDAAKTAAQAEIAKGIYTADSVKRVTDAIAAVVEGLDINSQTEVYAMAQAIDNAVALLEEDLANWARIDEAILAFANINTAIVTPASYQKAEAAVNALPTKGTDKFYAIQQAELDAYADAVLTAIASLEYMYADWSKVDNLYNELLNLDPAAYTNYDEIYYGSIYPYYSTTVADAKAADPYITNTRIDECYNQLLAYQAMLIPVQVEDDEEEVASFKFTGTAVTKKQGGVTYVYGLQPKLTKALFQKNFAEYENVTLEYEMTTTRYLGTGSKVTVKSTLDDSVIGEYVIVIYGDVDGNAVIDANDTVAVLMSTTGATGALTGAEKLAANLAGTRNIIDAGDVEAITSIVSGGASVDQVTGKLN